MKRMRGVVTLVAALAVATTGFAQATRTTPAIESMFRQAVTAISDERYIQATQLLTRLIGMPEHVHSRRAQELLGNVREANGQFAHAVAEYQIYLEKYPDGPGAERVSTRLANILNEAAPQPREPDVAAVIEDRPVPMRPRFGRDRFDTAAGGAPTDPNATTVISRGSIRLTYRYNEGATEITEIDPDPLIPNVTDTERDVFDNSLTAALRYSRIMENAARKVTLSFSGSVKASFDDDDDTDSRLYELSAEWEDKESGRVFTVGRHRLDPSGITYRLDGASLKWPSDSGIEFGVFAGSGVGSTSDGLFENDALLYGASVTMPKGMVGPGELSGYLVQEREDGFTLRQGLGVEYSLNMENGSIFANAEVDLKFGELNRALITGTRNLAGDARVTARLAHYRSPALSLSNALIGQSAGSLEALETAGVTEDQIEDLALNRTAKVTTLGFTYYRPMNDQWNLSAYGSLFHTGSKPASTGIAGADDVAEVPNDGVRTYVGARMVGQSIFRERDSVSFGLRNATADDNTLWVADGAMRIPAGEDLTWRPRLQVGYRDFDNGDTETFVLPSVTATYSVDRQTDLNVELGGRWSENDQGSTIVKQDQVYFGLGVSRSF